MAAKRRSQGPWALCAAGMWMFGATASLAAPTGKLRVAVTEPDIEIIVRAVGGNQVDTFSLFKGCILRKDLAVEPAVQDKLLKADAVVWTGFFNESAAINDVLGRPVAGSAPKGAERHWIDVSRER